MKAQVSVEDRYYVYGYLRKDGSFYYIGKGHGRRARHRTGRIIMPKRDASNVVILASNMNENDAFQAEMLLISLHGRIDNSTGCLRNRTDGGIGSKGLRWTESQLVKLKGRVRTKRTEESKHKTSESLQGHFVSESTRLKQRLAKLGKRNLNALD